MRDDKGRTVVPDIPRGSAGSALNYRMRDYDSQSRHNLRSSVQTLGSASCGGLKSERRRLYRCCFPDWAKLIEHSAGQRADPSCARIERSPTRCDTWEVTGSADSARPKWAHRLAVARSIGSIAQGRNTDKCGVTRAV